MPGKKRMELRITADRWPALRFSQVWNQLITINNPSETINANAMEIVAFTSIPKGDLVEGDILAIELAANNTTLVSLNGTTVLRTDTPALFTMLLNTWIGLRPPSSEFKRGILDAPKDKAGTDLIARYDSIHPNDSRKKVIAGWGFKAEPEVAATTAVATATATAHAATPPLAPTAVTKKAEPIAAAKSATEEKPKPQTPAPVTPPPPAQVAAATPPANTEAQEKQKALRNAYIAQIRKLVVKEIDYPKRAIKENIEGLVMVKIQVDRNGAMSAFNIMQSADDLLDAAAERAAKKAAPFPKPSDDLKGDMFEVLIPIVFKLTQ